MLASIEGLKEKISDSENEFEVIWLTLAMERFERMLVVENKKLVESQVYTLKMCFDTKGIARMDDVVRDIIVGFLL
jgi:hypothetical protein